MRERSSQRTLRLLSRRERSRFALPWFVVTSLLASPALANTVLTVDLSSTIRPVTHAASGSLYGVTEKLPADVDALIAPLHPNVFNNPAADVQQPVGDAIAVAGRVAPTGGRVTIRLADWFPGWPYKFSNVTDWLDKVSQTVSRKQASGVDNYYGYEIWNEPNGTWTSSTSFTDFWKQTYAKLRQLDPNAKIIGPSVAGYDRSYLQSFLTFAKNNNCLPDIVCWHELSGANFTANFASYRALEQQLGIGPLPISINEYSNKDVINDEGQPGASAPLIAKFERFQVDSACISYWDVAHPGRLGSLLATDTDTNGGWWFYKWYGDMTGSMVATTPPSPNDAAALDGFANVDSAAGTASVVFAGVNDGTIQIVVKGLAAALFRSKVHAIVEHTPFASRSTIVKATDVVSVADLSVANDQITVSVSNTNGTDGYRLSLSSIGGPVGSGGSGGSGGGASGSGGAMAGSGGSAAQRGGESGAGGVAAGGPGGGGGGLATGGAGGIGGSPATLVGTGGGAVSVLGDMGSTGHRGGCACSLLSARARGPSWAPWLAAFVALMRWRRRRQGNAAKGVLLAALLVTLGCGSSNPSSDNGGGSGGFGSSGVSGLPSTAPTMAAGGTTGLSGPGGDAGAAGNKASTGGSGGQSGSSGSGGFGNQGGSGASGSGASGTGAAGTSGSGGGGAAGSSGSSFNPCPTTGDPCKVLPFGDSITFGVGSDAQGGGGYRVDLFSRAVMAGKKLTFVGTQTNGPTTVAGMPFPQHHAGYSGYTIAQITATSLFNPEVATAPHIVLLHIGTNDMYRSDGSTAPQRLATLLDDLIMALPDSLIVVAKIIPLQSGMTQVNAYNSAITPLVQQRIDAGKHVVLVDQNTGFASTDLGSDGIHPNVTGYQKMAGVWYAAISALLR